MAKHFPSPKNCRATISLNAMMIKLIKKRTSWSIIFKIHEPNARKREKRSIYFLIEFSILFGIFRIYKCIGLLLISDESCFHNISFKIWLNSFAIKNLFHDLVLLSKGKILKRLCCLLLFGQIFFTSLDADHFWFFTVKHINFVNFSDNILTNSSIAIACELRDVWRS